MTTYAYTWTGEQMILLSSSESNELSQICVSSHMMRISKPNSSQTSQTLYTQRILLPKPVTIKRTLASLNLDETQILLYNMQLSTKFFSVEDFVKAYVACRLKLKFKLVLSTIADAPTESSKPWVFLMIQQAKMLNRECIRKYGCSLTNLESIVDANPVIIEVIGTCVIYNNGLSTDPTTTQRMIVLHQISPTT